MPKIRVDAVLPGNIVMHSHGGEDISVLSDTKANILATSGTAGQLAVTTNADIGPELYVCQGGTVWVKVPFKLVSQTSAVDMGAEQSSSSLGLGKDYVSNKVLANVSFGQSSDISSASNNKIPVRAYGGALQAYIGSVWKTIVLGFVFEEVAAYGYALFHTPNSVTRRIEVQSGNTPEYLGQNGLPTTQGYVTDMGCSPLPQAMGGFAY